MKTIYDHCTIFQTLWVTVYFPNDHHVSVRLSAPADMAQYEPQKIFGKQRDFNWFWLGEQKHLNDVIFMDTNSVESIFTAIKK